jgi:ferredoxin
LARLQALADTGDASAATLTKAFELTRPTALPGLKKIVQSCKDFASIREGEAFAAAMKTESKTPESACSGGTSCGSCAKRSTCASSKSGSPSAGQ